MISYISNISIRNAFKNSHILYQIKISYLVQEMYEESLKEDLYDQDQLLL